MREVLALTPDLFNGFGVALVGGITFIDLDHVRDAETGVVDDWAMDLVRLFDSWAEISVSGEGMHVFCFGSLPSTGLVGYLDGDPDHKVEAYDRGRFAYLTGHPVEPVRPLADRQRLVTLLAKHVRPVSVGLGGTPVRDGSPIPEGARNDSLFRIARGFVFHGLVGRELEQALRAVNRRRCVPPLTDYEVVQLARHAERLPDRRPA
jgi:hypothetical protein